MAPKFIYQRIKLRKEIRKLGRHGFRIVAFNHNGACGFIERPVRRKFGNSDRSTRSKNLLLVAYLNAQSTRLDRKRLFKVFVYVHRRTRRGRPCLKLQLDPAVGGRQYRLIKSLGVANEAVTRLKIGREVGFFRRENIIAQDEADDKIRDDDRDCPKTMRLMVLIIGD